MVGDMVYQFYGSDICIVTRPKADAYELIGRAAVAKQGLGRGREDETNHFTGEIYRFSAFSSMWFNRDAQKFALTLHPYDILALTLGSSKADWETRV